jgi:hypothetical protein
VNCLWELLNPGYEFSCPHVSNACMQSSIMAACRVWEQHSKSCKWCICNPSRSIPGIDNSGNENVRSLFPPFLCLGICDGKGGRCGSFVLHVEVRPRGRVYGNTDVISRVYRQQRRTRAELQPALPCWTAPTLSTETSTSMFHWSMVLSGGTEGERGAEGQR